mgnify:CR=1 FL=1
MEEKKETPTIEQLEAAVKADKTEREQKCLAQITPILEEYKCVLIGLPYITNKGEISAQVQITAL